MGKSRKQINREIKAGKLLALSMGNRGQRIPGWQLDSLKCQLVHTVMQQAGSEVDSWSLHLTLVRPCEQLGGRSPVEAAAADNLDETVRVVQVALECGVEQRLISV